MPISRLVHRYWPCRSRTIQGRSTSSPTHDRRRRVLPSFFRCFMAAALAADGDLVVTGEPVGGVASWFGPDHFEPSPEAMAANGFDEFLALLRQESAARLLSMLVEIDRQHAELARGPHRRLEFLGVLPERQGTGIGSALIEHGHRRADELGVPCHLETFSTRDVEFYERRGYRVAGEFMVGAGTRGCRRRCWPTARRQRARAAGHHRRSRGSGPPARDARGGDAACQ